MTPANVKVGEQLEKVIQFAKFDETVPQSRFDELQHQRQLLNTFGDAKAAAANLATLSQQLLAGAQQHQAQLQAHVDRASARTEAFKAGQVGFDREPVARNDLYGNPEMVLTFGGQSVTISRAQFTGKATGELLQTHFGVTA